MTRNRLCFARPAEAHQRVSDIAVCSILVVSLDLIDERIEPAYPCRIWIFRKLRQRYNFGITIEHLEINFLLSLYQLKGMIQYGMSTIRLMPDGPEQLGGAVSRRSNHMKRKSTLQLIVILLAVMFALFSFTACKDNPNAPPETGEEQTGNPDDNPPVLSDEEALKGQWFVYVVPYGEQQMKFSGYVIDIQYTEPGYWISAQMTDGSDTNAEILWGFESNRTRQDDGWFVVTTSEAEGGYEIRYRFKDSDRNTLETKVIITDGSDSYEMQPELRRNMGDAIKLSYPEEQQPGT